MQSKITKSQIVLWSCLISLNISLIFQRCLQKVVDDKISFAHFRNQVTDCRCSVPQPYHNNTQMFHNLQRFFSHFKRKFLFQKYTPSQRHHLNTPRTPSFISMSPRTFELPLYSPPTVTTITNPNSKILSPLPPAPALL